MDELRSKTDWLRPLKEAEDPADIVPPITFRMDTKAEVCTMVTVISGAIADTMFLPEPILESVSIRR